MLAVCMLPNFGENVRRFSLPAFLFRLFSLVHTVREIIREWHALEFPDIWSKKRKVAHHQSDRKNVDSSQGVVVGIVLAGHSVAITGEASVTVSFFPSQFFPYGKNWLGGNSGLLQEIPACYTGTGKTFAIKEICRRLKRKKEVALLCSTGMRCLQFLEEGAQTVHRWSIIGCTFEGSEYIASILPCYHPILSFFSSTPTISSNCHPPPPPFYLSGVLKNFPIALFIIMRRVHPVNQGDIVIGSQADLSQDTKSYIIF